MSMKVVEKIQQVGFLRWFMDADESRADVGSLRIRSTSVFANICEIDTNPNESSRILHLTSLCVQKFNLCYRNRCCRGN